MTISHSVLDFHAYGRQMASNPAEYVRLHFGLSGSYQFYWKQLDMSFDLQGHHNNIMYTNGFDMEVENKSKHLETFGINMQPDAFLSIASRGNDQLKRFADKVLRKEDALFSPEWKTTNLRIQEVIQDILDCPFADGLKDLFLLSKSIELLVLQAEQFEGKTAASFIQKSSDKQKLIEAKELLNTRLEDPPTIVELAKLVGLNEFKLKKGFKELFGTTIFGFIHSRRMRLAKQLLLGTDKSAKEIAYEIGYNSPQYFSKAFKKEFGCSPNSIRKAPDPSLN